MEKFDDYINVTAPLHSATTKGKLGNANEIFTENDDDNIQNVVNKTNEHLKRLDNRSSQMEESIKNISVTGGASVASAVTYDNTDSGLEAVNVKGAVDELANKKFNKENIAQESGDSEELVMSQKAITDNLNRRYIEANFKPYLFQKIKGYVNKNGVWGSRTYGSYTLIPIITQGLTLSITSGRNTARIIFFNRFIHPEFDQDLTEARVGEIVEVPSLKTKSMSVPEGTSYIYILITVANSDLNYLPKRLTLNGVDYMSNIREDIHSIREDVSVLTLFSQNTRTANLNVLATDGIENGKITDFIKAISSISMDIRKNFTVFLWVDNNIKGHISFYISNFYNEETWTNKSYWLDLNTKDIESLQNTNVILQKAITELENSINSIKKDVYTEVTSDYIKEILQQGYLTDADGEEADGTIRIRTKRIDTNIITFKIEGDCEMSIRKFDSEGNLIRGTGDWYGKNSDYIKVVMKDASYFRLVFRKASDKQADITPSDYASFGLSVINTYAKPYEKPKFFIDYKKVSKNSLNGETSLLTCYSHVKDDLYIGFGFALCKNTSEIVYHNMWRLQYIDEYKYFYDSFEKIRSLAHTSENEFTFKQRGKIDFTGGWHGDERIDISNDSYVMFIVDGVPIQKDSLKKDFSRKCTSFSFRQMSTLHETASTIDVPISGHPIIATHLKEERILGGKIIIRNKVSFKKPIGIDTYFTGVFCLGKNAASYVCMEDNGVIEMTSSDKRTEATDGMSREVIAWNTSTNIGATLTSKFLRCRENDKCERMTVWDRTTDSKYYGYTNIKSVEANDVIETEMVAEYLL